jgi:hypothetical protein
MAETTPEATAKVLRDTLSNAIRTQNIPKDQWITVSLYDNPKNSPGTARSWLYLGRLNRRQIDGATPDHPVLISTLLQGLFNTEAIETLKKVFPDWEESTDLENRPGAGQDGYAAVPEIHGMRWE